MLAIGQRSTVHISTSRERQDFGGRAIFSEGRDLMNHREIGPAGRPIGGSLRKKF
jgi:hypothetical protein